MQIDRYNYLQFPRDNTATAPSNDAAADPSGVGAGVGAGKSQAKPAPLSPPPSNVRADSVVLKIQWPDSPSADALKADSPVYSKAQTGAVTPASATSDDQLQAHLAAVGRNAGVFTQITLNKDGVLVAKPQPAAQTKAPDFVALAVSAMREYSDENDRVKARASATSAPTTPAPEPARGALKGLQQLAAKFNVFA